MASNFYPSANMGLPVPTVSLDPGPDYASNVNAALTLVDAHDHSAGNGVQITPAGINVNSDFPLNGNNLLSARSLRLQVNTSALVLATDLNCLNDINGDLYFIDGLGNQVRITQSGGVAGSPGSISNLTAPASAAYVSVNSTFVWQSAANTPANLDAASIILRNLTANSKGLTLNPPNAMGANYSITLPALPASARVLSIDNSGNIGTNVAGTVQTTDVADASITLAKLAAPHVLVGGTSGSASTTSSTYVGVPNLSLGYTSTGRPVQILFQPENAGANQPSAIGCNGNFANFRILRNGTQVSEVQLSTNNTSNQINVPPAALNFLDVSAPAGANTWSLQYRAGFSSTAACEKVVMVIYEQ